MPEEQASTADDRFTPLKVPSAYEMVAQSIEREIMAGRLRPGDEVGTEAELVRQFGVNRSTVREGIRVLEQSGLVRREAGRRLFVSLPRWRNLSSRMSRAMVLQEVTFTEVLDAARVLEMGIARAAAENANAEDVAALEENLAQTRCVAELPEQLAAMDEAFHKLIARATHNRVLELAREPAALLFFPTSALIFRTVQEAPGRLVQAHERLVAAISAGDAQEAENWMQRHLRDWLKGYRRTGRDPDAPVEWALAETGL